MKILLPFYCLFAHMAIATHLGIMYYKASGSQEAKALEESLNKEQKAIYKKIKDERKCHYKCGLILGIIISAIYMRMMNGNNKNMICSYIGITTLIANTYYTLMPKSYWMVEHLSTLEQVQLHNEVYKKFRCITSYGNLVGFIIFAIGQLK